MRAASSGILGLAVAALLGGCSGETVIAGVDEPLRVRNGQFFEGELPGSPPLTAAEVAEGVAPLTPTVTSVDGASGSARFGDPDRSLRGRASGDAVAVAARFESVGSGYWVVPVSGLDAQNEGEFTFTMNSEFSRDLPPGQHQLLFAAIGEDLSSGTQRRVGFCVPSPVPDNSNACNPRRKPPSLVVSLEWDVNSDLDLQVFTPSGVLVDAKNPTGTPESGPSGGPSGKASAGRLDLDSNASCRIDDIRRESLIFDEAPPSGEYFVYANLFDPCGQRATHFTVTVHEAVPGDEPDTFRQVERSRTPGVLLPVQANGGKDIGILVSKFIVP